MTTDFVRRGKRAFVFSWDSVCNSCDDHKDKKKFNQVLNFEPYFIFMIQSSLKCEFKLKGFSFTVYFITNTNLEIS